MASFIMAGRIQAAIFIVLSTLISLVLSPLIVFSNAAIALITLRKGWRQGILYALLASVTLVVVSILLKQQASSSLITGVVKWLPMVLLSSALAVTNSWGKTLQLTLLLGTAGVLLFHLSQPDANAFWKPVLEQIKSLLLKTQQTYQLSEGKIDEFINNFSHWMTGIFAATFAMITTLSLIIARNWQALLYNPGGFGEEFRQIRIGTQASIAFIVGIAIAVITANHLIIELIMVGVAVFMFQGLSLAHSIVKQREMNVRWLVALYVLMFLLLIQIIVLLATFGLVDNFADFRRKIVKRN